MPLPTLPLLTEISARLAVIFPETFPDRAILVGEMASRFAFVSLYGGFIEGTGRYLRPSTITKAVCEVLAVRMFEQPVIVHVSHSDKKTFKELEGEAEAVGIKIDPSAELPDIVMVDIASDYGMVVCFVEVVHSDGPITELRKQALLKLAADAGIEPRHVRMVTAFDDRGSPAFKKRVSELARESSVWFRTEPELLLRLDTMLERQAK